MDLPRSLLFALAAATLGATSAAQEQCPAGAFGTDPDKIAAAFASVSEEPALFKTEHENPTLEVSRIREGAVGYYAGAFINDGLQSWWSYDATRHLFLQVEGTAARFAMMPDLRSLTPNQIVRSSGIWTYLVTAVRATPEEAREFACRANEIMAWNSTHEDTPKGNTHDSPPAPDDSSASPPKSRRRPTSLPEVKVMGNKPCTRDLPTDTFQQSFRIFTDKAPVPVESGHRCGCDCQAAGREREDQLSGWVANHLNDASAHARQTPRSAHVISLALDAADNLYLLIDPGAHRSPSINIVKLAPSGEVTHISAGVQRALYARHMVVDPEGNALVPAFSGNATDIYEIAPVEFPVLIAHEKNVKGSLPVEWGLESDVAIDGRGNLYAIVHGRIVKIASDGQVTTSAANLSAEESAEESGAADSGGGSSLPFNIAVAANGDVFVAESRSQVIRKVTRDGVMSIFAGKEGISGVNDGRGAQVRFNIPSGLAFDRHGNLYVADSDNHTIRRIAPSGRVSTLAGMAGERGNVDGRGIRARFDTPSHIAVDSHGTVYVINSNDNLIRKITPSGFVSTLDADKWINDE